MLDQYVINHPIIRRELGVASIEPGALSSTFRPSGGDNNWYTPKHVVAAARETMRGIDLDPASCEAANQVVRAAKYYTEDDNGLLQPWRGTVFMNPPYGGTVVGDDGKPKRIKDMFVQKLTYHLLRGEVTQACFISPQDFSPRWGDFIRNHAAAICFEVGAMGWDFWKPDNSTGGVQSLMAYFGPYPPSVRRAVLEVRGRFRLHAVSPPYDGLRGRV